MLNALVEKKYIKGLYLMNAVHMFYPNTDTNIKIYDDHLIRYNDRKNRIK